MYLLPSVVGGGLGDIAEVFDAGHLLADAGYSVQVYRARNDPLPAEVDGRWDWSGIVRSQRRTPAATHALTISACWGVSAAPARDEPYGKGGPWSRTASELESAYGAERTLHVSLEEFARTYSSRRENQERYREGGVPARVSRGRDPRADRDDEDRWAAAFRKFRALDRPNVLHLFATFERSGAFAREFPEALQVGPLWPHGRMLREARRRARSGRPRVVWYASPSTSERIAPAVAEGCSRLPAVVELTIRSPRPIEIAPTPHVGVKLLPPLAATDWRSRFDSADLRIVTGSRSLLEALVVGGPFLYFNGTLGIGRRARRHRPEKIAALLQLWRRVGADRRVRRDLEAFSRGQRIAEIVATSLNDAGWRRRFPRWSAGWTRRAGLEDASSVLLGAARALSSPAASSEEIVARFRRRGAAGRFRS